MKINTRKIPSISNPVLAASAVTINALASYWSHGFRLAGVAGCFVASSFPGLAAEKVYELEEFVVTATKTETRINEIGSSITVLNSDTLERRGYISVFEAIGSIPGVSTTRNGGPGTSEGINIRGMDANQTLILVDGFELNDSSQTSGVLNLGTIPVDLIERIEVLRGPQSMAYGSDAMAGVINIITKQGDGDPQHQLNLERGSFGTGKASFTSRGSINKWDYSLLASIFETEGFSASSEPGQEDDDDYENAVLQGNLAYNLNQNARISTFITRQKSTFDFDNPVNSFGRSENALWGLRGDFVLLDEALTLKPQISLTDSENISSGSSVSTTEGRSINVFLDSEYRLSEMWTLYGGVDYQEDDAKADDYENTRDNISGFLQVGYAADEVLFLTLGGRFDDNSDFGDKATWRATANYVFEETKTRIFGTYGTGFRAPTLAEQFGTFGGFAIINPDLTAEFSRGFDFGVEQEFLSGKLVGNVTYFNNNVDDQIAFVFVAFPGQFQNVDEVETQGAEVSLSYYPTDSLFFSANYTYTDAEDKTTGLQLGRRPEHQAYIEGNWTLKENKLMLNIRLSYIGSRFDRANEVDEMGGYSVVDSKISYQLSDSMKVYLRVDNVFDREYENIRDFATPERSAYLGLSYSF
ncbi:MAG: TonB-dependent receptor [Verrucomicrobiota bacterium]